jgi:hypothetical protein
MANQTIILKGGTWDGENAVVDKLHDNLMTVPKNEDTFGTLQQSGDYEIYKRESKDTFVFSRYVASRKPRYTRDQVSNFKGEIPGINDFLK